jgi:hypothetical protein
LPSNERIKFYSKDISELLAENSEFRTLYKKKIGLLHADIPFGYFAQDPADIPYLQSQVTLIAVASKDLLTETGTVVLNMCDRGAGM